AFACGAAATAVSISVSAKTAMRCMAVLPLDAACVVQRAGCRQTSRFACASRDWRNDLMLFDRKSDGDVACCHTTSVPGLIGTAAIEGECGHRIAQITARAVRAKPAAAGSRWRSCVAAARHPR